MRFVRWSGLLVFVGLVAAVGLFWWLLVDWIVERAIEATGTEIVGARVDLDAADLSLWPAGLELTRLQVTNPSEPMTNAFEVGRIAGGFDLVQALLGKVIIDELAVEGLRFGTPREKSGAISGRFTTELARDAAESAARQLELPDFELPDRDDLVEGAELESAALVAELRGEVEAERARWQARLDELPDEADLERYRARIDALGKQGGKPGLGSIGAAGDAADLVRDIRTDVEALEQASKGFQQELAGLRGRADAVAKAKARDIAALRERYGVSPEGLSNLTALLLGPKIESLVRQGFAWHARLRPLIDAVRASDEPEEGPMVVEHLRGRSVEVRFPEPAPLPGWLVRRTGVSVSLDAGEFSGTILDWTAEQPVLGRPTTASFAADALEGLRALRLEAVFDHVRPAAARDVIEGRADAFRVKETVLSASEAWPVRLEAALADAKARVEIAGGEVDTQLGVVMRDVALAADFGDSAIARALGDALEATRRFRLDVRATGRVDDLDVAISSDLDGVLRDAAGGLVRGQMAELERRLGSQLDARLADGQAALSSDLKALGGVGEVLEQRLGPAKSLLSEAMGSSKPALPGGFKLPGR